MVTSCLELGEVDVEGALEAQRRRYGRHDLPDQPVQIRVRRSFDGQVPPTDVLSNKQDQTISISFTTISAGASR